MVAQPLWSKTMASYRLARRNLPAPGRRRRSRRTFETLESRLVLASMIADLNTASLASSEPSQFVDVGGVLSVMGSDATHDAELWNSNGAASGALLVKNIRSDTGSNPRQLTNVDGTLFFTADDGVVGEELWKSDATAAGTLLVRDLDPGDGSSEPEELTNVDGTLYFTAWVPIDSGGYEGMYQVLIQSDGTPDGTVAVQSGGAYYPSSLTDVSGRLFFRAINREFAYELWTSDGTSEGTLQLTDSSTYFGSHQRFMTNFNESLYFAHSVEDWDESGPPELWKSDGTVEGTVRVSDVRPRDLTVSGETLFFTGGMATGTAGDELWKTDGTSEGTVQVKEIYPGAFSSRIANLKNVNGTLFFQANDGISGEELWKSDGTDAGTVLVKDLHPGSEASTPSHLTDVDGTLYFLADDGAHGRELWMSDGTAAGTVMVKDIHPGATSSNITDLTNVNGSLYFRANDGTRGYEIWTSDGTPEGTVIAAEIVPGSGDGDPRELTAIGEDLYFTADDGIHGRELWILRTGNVAPSADAGGPYQIHEGNELLLDASGSSDPNADPLSFTWDLTGDGDFNDADGPMPMLTWAELIALGIDDSGNHTVSVRVADGQGAVSDAIGVLTVLNTAPTATLSSEAIAAGEPVTVTLTDPFDPSPADTAAGFRYAYALDPDSLQSVTYATGSTTVASWTFTGLSPGTHTVHARIIDQDDGFSVHSIVIEIPAGVLAPQVDHESIDLSERLEEELAGIGLIDLRGFGANLLTLDAERIETLFAASSATVIAEPEDTVIFDGPWSFAEVELIDGEVFRRFSQGGAVLRLRGPLDFTNPTNRFDVNASGSVSPLDALLVLNATRGAPVRFTDAHSAFLPLTEETAAAYKFIDVNGDGLLTPLDALLVLNEIARIHRESPLAESEPLMAAPPPERPTAPLRQPASPPEPGLAAHRVEPLVKAASDWSTTTPATRPPRLPIAEHQRPAEPDQPRLSGTRIALLDEALTDPQLLA